MNLKFDMRFYELFLMNMSEVSQKNSFWNFAMCEIQKFENPMCDCRFQKIPPEALLPLFF